MSIYDPLGFYSSLNLSRNPNLDFVAAPALAPAEVAVDANLMAAYEAELRLVRSLIS
jgi:hypothetical protein